MDVAANPAIYDKRMWGVDRLHPSERGHRLLARLFALSLPLPLLALLRTGKVAQCAHPFAQRLDGIGLALHRARRIALAQRAFGVRHRAARFVQTLARGIAFGRALSGQKALLPLQFLAQGLLAVGKRALARLSALPALSLAALTSAALLPGLRPLLSRLLALALAALGFLGLGTQPPAPEWGRMLSENMPYVERAPWAVLAPAAALAVLGALAVLLAAAVRGRAGADTATATAPTAPAACEAAA